MTIDYTLCLLFRFDTTPLIMAWTWKGFWGDDPVYRFNCGNNFWHAGRSKAEERFWVDHVHGDGSYKTPLR